MTSICEKHFNENYTREKTKNKNGRSVFKMPLKEANLTVENFELIAMEKNKYLWNRLAKDHNYLKFHSGFLKTISTVRPYGSC